MDLLGIVFVAFAAAALLTLLKGSEKNDEEQREQDRPCDTCVRYHECNCIDDECPRKELI